MILVGLGRTSSRPGTMRTKNASVQDGRRKKKTRQRREMKVDGWGEREAGSTEEKRKTEDKRGKGGGNKERKKERKNTVSKEARREA